MIFKNPDFVERKDPLWFAIKKLYDKYVSKDKRFQSTFSSSSAIGYDQEGEFKDELIFQRNRVQDKLVTIQNKNKRSEKELGDELLRKQKENAILLNEINDLRKEKHDQ